MTTPNEPEVIAEARRTGTLSVGAILAEYDRVCAERDAAVRQREDVSSQLWDCMNEREGYRARLAACERVVEAAKAYEKWMGKWHDYTKATGDVPHKVEAALINAVRAAVAAETQTTTTKDTTL